jgi:prefoldin alpha subunit
MLQHITIVGYLAMELVGLIVLSLEKKRKRVKKKICLDNKHTNFFLLDLIMSATTASASSDQQPVGLSMAQIEQVRTQLQSDIEMLQSSIQRLQYAQEGFGESMLAVSRLPTNNQDNSLLVPLSSSMYVPGRLSDPEHVLVDIGTGFFVEMRPKKAQDYFKRKHDYIQVEIDKLQKVLYDKLLTRQQINGIIQMHLQQQQQQQQPK